MALSALPQAQGVLVPLYSASAWDGEAVNISSTDYTPATTARGLYVGGAGDVILVTAAGNSVTFKAVPAGTVLAVFFTTVTRSGTTATNMVALS